MKKINLNKFLKASISAQGHCKNYLFAFQLELFLRVSWQQIGKISISSRSVEIIKTSLSVIPGICGINETITYFFRASVKHFAKRYTNNTRQCTSGDAIKLQFSPAYTFYYAHDAQLPADNTPRIHWFAACILFLWFTRRRNYKLGIVCVRECIRGARVFVSIKWPWSAFELMHIQ